MIGRKLSRFVFQACFAFLILGVSAAFAAWQGPSSEPPQGNVPAPINVGPLFQEKLGALWASSIGTDAGFCIKESCISSWSQAGRTLSCPEGFSLLSSKGRTLGCLQKLTQGKQTYRDALMTCWNTYGARLPSYAELSIGKEALGISTLNDAWLSEGNSRPVEEQSPYRCFIPAGA